MTTQPLQQERRVADAIVDVLAEAGVRVRARHARRLHGTDLLGAPRAPVDPHGPGARGVDRLHDGRGLRAPHRPAARRDGPGRVDRRQRRPGLPRGDDGQLADRDPHRDERRRPRSSHHAPYQSGTGDYGTWDARSALAGVTKRVMVSHDPAQAVQHVQLALKHALTGEPGPVAVIFHSSALRGKVGPRLDAAHLPDRRLPAAAAPTPSTRRRSPARSPPSTARAPAGDHRRQRRARRPGVAAAGRAGLGASTSRSPPRPAARACSTRPTRWPPA